MFEAPTEMRNQRILAGLILLFLLAVFALFNG